LKAPFSQKTTVCVLTARGMAAISSVAVAGADARAILGNVFHSGTNTAKQSLTVAPGEILHGSIVDGQRVIDEVVVGCEGENTFVIHCHGNPLLVEQIVTLLQSHGAELIDADRFARASYQKSTSNTIEAEARLAMQKSATVAGVKILQAQISGGLSQWAQDTLTAIDTLNIDHFKQRCGEILQQSKIAQRIIEGVRIVIAGPPNSGKSTLLNCLAGQEQVIVSDAAGTTRDWVSIICYLGDRAVCAEFIDTAGLDDALADADDIERTAQKMTRDLLKSCDLVLFVQDVTQQAEGAAHVPVIYVNNKCDLIQEHKNTRTREPKSFSISAKDNNGIDLLVQGIIEQLGVVDFDAAEPAAFTQRQRNLLSAIINTNQSPEEILSDLLGLRPTSRY